MSDETENFDNPSADDSSAEDDWAAAMAEQAIAEAAPPAAQAAQIFPSFGESTGKASMMNELDMILDIPVQISV